MNICAATIDRLSHGTGIVNHIISHISGNCEWEPVYQLTGADAINPAYKYPIPQEKFDEAENFLRNLFYFCDSGYPYGTPGKVETPWGLLELEYSDLEDGQSSTGRFIINGHIFEITPAKDKG